MPGRVRVTLRAWWLRPHAFAEMYSALVLLAFAGWSTVEPISTPSLRTFHEAARIAPSWMWTCAAGSIGGAQVTALLLDRRWLRGMVAFFSAWLLAGVSLCAVLAYPSPVDAFPLVFLVVNLVAVVRTARSMP